MNVEKTMEFILAQQAKAEGQMAAIRTLIRTGMKMILKNEEHLKELAAAQKETGAALKELAEAHKDLAAAHKETEAALKGLINSLRRGGNGRHSKN